MMPSTRPIPDFSLLPLPAIHFGTGRFFMLAEATREHIVQLCLIDFLHPALQRYANADVILSGVDSKDVHAGCERLVETLEEWQEHQIGRAHV